jgi:two-component system, cell cycle sensor histidine kinase and response regulator CckA
MWCNLPAVEQIGTHFDFSALLDALPDAVIVVDGAGVIRVANTQTQELFGYRQEELQGQFVEILVPAQLRCGHANHRATYFHQPRLRPMGVGLELHGCRKDGSEFPVEISLNPMQHETGALVIAAIRDVSERKRSEKNFRALLESAPDAMVIVDAGGKITIVNSQTERLFRYTREELLGQSVERLVPARFRRDHGGHRVGFLAQPQSRAMGSGLDLFALRSDGTEFPVEISLSPLETDTGVVVTAAIRDITERKKADQEMAALYRKVAEEAAYRSLVEHAPYGIYRADLETDRFLAVNPALVTMLGYDNTEEVLQLSISKDVYGDSYERQRVLERKRSEAQFHGIETRWKRKDGTIVFVRLSGSSERGTHALRYLDAVVEDITERKKLEEQFQQSQKMEAIARLAGGLAHDFNNIIGVVIGQAELLAGGLKESGQQLKRVDAILTAANRAASLNKQLLAFTRQQVLAPKIISLNDVVSEAEKILDRVVGEDVDLVARLAADLRNTHADPNQLQQVVINLVINARDAMPDGGKLVIETDNTTFDESYMLDSRGKIRPGDYVMLAVTDSGIGMDAATRARAFEPFFTTKPVGKGTGLGLASVHGIVHQSGGHIFLYSEPGQGTTVKVYLPAVSEASETSAPLQPLQSADGDETVLVTEDDPLLRDVIVDALSSHGYRILTAENGTAALTLAQQYNGTIDLVISDIVMPGMSGPKLARALQEAFPGISVLLMSGYSTEALDRFGTSESHHFLQKPFSPIRLAIRVREILDQRRAELNAS